MMQRPLPQRSAFAEPRGAALLTVIVFVVIMGVFATSVATRMLLEKREVDAYVDRVLALHAAEYAVEMAKARIVSGQSGTIGVAADGAVFPLPALSDGRVTPVAVPEFPGAAVYAVAINWSSDGKDNDGNGTVDGPEEAGLITIYGVGWKSARTIRFTRTIQTLEVNVRVQSSGDVSGAPAGLQQLSWREVRSPAVE